VMTAVLDPGRVFVIGQTTVTAAATLPGSAPTVGSATAAGSAPTTGVPTRPDAGAALQVSAGRGLAIDVDDVTVVVEKGRTAGRVLLDRVDLHVPAGAVVALVGPSGAGKSSLVHLLLGTYRPVSGTVRIGGARSAGRPAGRQQVRYVPQSDDLYGALTVRETLTIAARFRAARDASEQYVRDRVAAALDWLGLREVADNLVSTLSGGQRRRVSIGTELVGRPQLLLLDEPTSGLDVGKDRDIMRRLHAISRELHCTVVIVTHSVAHLEQVDQLVAIGRGGRVRYAGPPVDPASQGYPTWADWLVELDRAPAAKPAVRRARPHAPGPGRTGTGHPGFTQALLRQAVLLTRRGWKALAQLAGLPLVGTGLAVLASADGLRPGPGMPQVLSILVTVAALTGAALTYLDLVHDRNILHRDWRVGIASRTLLLAKAAVYATVCGVLAAAITLAYAAFRDLPPPALGIAPTVLLFGALFAVMVSSMGLGMLVSALADSLEQAVGYNTLLAVFQVALNGALFEVPLWMTAVLPARLGLGAVASYADLNTHRPTGVYHDPLWQDAAFWVPLTLIGMGLVTAWSITVAIQLTERRWRG
ncbi:ATP-binding cassette domain-containing protein, partial [Micromonospora echinofusca]